MKTRRKPFFAVISLMCLTGLLMAQTKSGDRPKKAAGANTAMPQAASEKKPAEDKSVSASEDSKSDSKSKDPLENMKFRNLGPAVGGGRVTTVVGIPGKPNVYYVGAAGGGVFLTQDGGLSWKPIFEKESTASIGAIALAPSNPNLIWVGTGEKNIRNEEPNGAICRNVARAAISMGA